jgi:DNA-binding CsgD family transcriptional regulator
MLFGRGDELGTATALVASARDGRGGALLMHGEAGVGKSALLAEAVAGATGMLVLSAQGLETESDLPFAGLTALLGPLLAMLGALPAIQRDALAGALGLGPPWTGEPFTTYQGATTLITHASRDQPILATVDDVQWLDGASQQALRFASRRLERSSVALLLTRRDEAGDHDPWPGVEDLPVAGLAESASLELLETRGVVRDVARRIAVATAGNALALTESSALLTEEQRKGRAPLEDPLPIGDQLTRAFSARAAALPDVTRQALVIAGASESGDARTIGAALVDRGSGLFALEAAEKSGLVVLDGATVVFAHPLVRAAVVGSADPAGRRDAHRALAAHTTGAARAWHRAAAAAAPDEAVASELEAIGAEARARGALPASSAAFERAAALSPDVTVRAGRRLQAALDALEDGQLERAIALLDAVINEADDPLARADAELLRGVAEMLRGHPMRAHARLYAEARRVEPVDPARAAQMLCQAGVAFMAVGGMQALLDITHEARRAAAASGNPEVGILPTIQAGLALMADGRAEEGLPLLDEHEEYLRSVDPLGPMNEVLGMVCVCLTWVDDLQRAADLAAHQVEAARGAGATRALAFPLAVHAHVLARQGRLVRAAALIDEAVVLADETAHGMVLAFALGVGARIDAVRGEFERSRERAQRSMGIATGLGLHAVTPYGRSALGLLELTNGSPSDAFDLLRTAIVDSREIGNIEHGFLLVRSDAIEAALRAGRVDDARRCLDELARDAETSPRVFTRAALARYRGALGPDAEVDEHFGEALRLHEQIDLRFERARTLLLYGERLRRARRRGDARERLQDAVAEFDRTGAVPWIARAGAELEAATGSGRRAAPAPAASEPLTPQEQRIAELVGTGATNKEIAAQLYLSPRTIEFHLRGAFRKLGVTTRTQLAAAMRDGDG